MKFKIRDLGFFSSLILIIFIAVFLLVSKIKEGGLDYYLELLGEQLIEMVPDIQGKELIAARYDDFLNKVKSEEVSPEEVERVAYRILNLSGRDILLSNDEALTLFDLSKVYPNEFSRTIEMPREKLEPEPRLNRDKVLRSRSNERIAARQKAYEKLEERLKSIVDLNIRMKDFTLSDSMKIFKLGNKIRYDFDGEIKVRIDDKVRVELERQKKRALLSEIKNLENNQILIWQKEFQKAHKEALEEIENSLQSIPDSLIKSNKVKQLNNKKLLRDSLRLKRED